MKPNNVNTFLGLAALWLVMASSSLGAPLESHTESTDIGDELLIYLRSMESYVCNGTYSTTTNNQDRSENCFIYELENIEKACCTTIGDTNFHSVNELVFHVRRHAKAFYEPNNYTKSSCEGFEPKTFTDYIKAFQSLVQRKIDMLHRTK